MRKLFHSYIMPPIKVRIRSKLLSLDHTYEPVVTENVTSGYPELFVLAENPIFDDIFILLDSENWAYYYENGKRIFLKGWYNIRDFEYGGICEQQDEKYTDIEIENVYPENYFQKAVM